MSKFDIELPVPFSEDNSTNKISFDRVCVILGANGVGKSRSLEALKDNFQKGQKRVLYVEGGRVVNINKNVRMERHDSLYRRSKEDLDKQIKQLGFKNLRGRLRQALDYLFRNYVAEKVDYAESVESWKEGEIPEPNKKNTKLDHVIELFTQVFPQITLEVDVSAEELNCYKNGNKYGPSDLSDGEKQVLSILSDFSAFGESIDFVIVDEPELNLNPSLAVRLWNVIESDLSETKFLYATHSIGFAIRKNVDSVCVLSSNKNIIEIDNIHSIENGELKHFLGSVPAILSAEKALAVEGEDNSLDNPFYNSILNDTENIAITSVGGSSNVLAARHQNGLWNKIAGQVKIIGIVDRDFRSNEEISKLEQSNCIVLDLHELESYLCLPELICGVAEARALDPKPSQSEVIDKIQEFLISEKYKITSRLVERILHLTLRPSIKAKEIANIDSLDKLKKKFTEYSKDEMAKAGSLYSADKIDGALEKELNKVEEAIQSREPNEMLKFAPGKQLIKRLLYLAGCKSELELIEAANKLEVITQVETIKNLSQKIDIQLN